MKDIVVLAGSTPWSVLSLCKCAYKHKVKAYVVCYANGWGRKYAHSHLVYKSYDVKESDETVFWTQFFKENQFEERPILYVTSDYVCQIVNRNRSYYESSFDLCVASPYILDSFIDKNRAGVEAEKHGLTVPLTKELKEQEDVQYVVDAFQFPVIVKPVTYLDHSKAKFKTHICDTPDDFISFVSKFFDGDIELQCQEYIQGEDKDCFFYQFYRNDKGVAVECMGEKTLQTDGIMTVGTTRYDERVASKSRAFLDSINYVGIGGIEYKRYNGKDYFIEMSTRTEGFLAISDMAGVSLAEASMIDKSRGVLADVRQCDDTQYVVFVPWLMSAMKKCAFSVVPRFLKIAFARKSHFVGAFLDACFSIKLLLKLVK